MIVARLCEGAVPAGLKQKQKYKKTKTQNLFAFQGGIFITIFNSPTWLAEN